VRLFRYRTVHWTWLLVWKLLLKRGEEYVTGPLLERDCSRNVDRTWSFLGLMKGVFWASVTKWADTRSNNLCYRGCCTFILPVYGTVSGVCVCVCVCVYVYKIRRVWKLSFHNQHCTKIGSICETLCNTFSWGTALFSEDCSAFQIMVSVASNRCSGEIL